MDSKVKYWLRKSVYFLRLAGDLAEDRAKVMAIQCLSYHSLITDDKFTEVRESETKGKPK